MAGYTAADVKALREETGAPMMECKTALEEAGGDFEKAKQLLREKGKAAAAKRAGRSTSEGVAAVAVSSDKKRIGAVVLECETDFVSTNAQFVELASKIASVYLDSDPGSDPLAPTSDGKSVGQLIEEAVAVIRENIRVAEAVHLETTGAFEVYVHHDRKKAAVVEVQGPSGEVTRKIAIQVVTNPPEVVSKDQISKEMLDKEIETETQRAIGEGKDEKIARNVAVGRVNKEFVMQAALLEQPYYAELSKKVGDYLKENAKDSQIVSFRYLAVGKN